MGAVLRSANLSGAVGLLSSTQYMEEHFEHDRRGYLVYKTFGQFNNPPASWKLEPGSIIEEVCNPDRATDCGSGVNVGTLAWVQGNNGKHLRVHQLRIRWKDCPGVVVPYMTDGKIRCERAEIVKVLP
jgi:hypothetical protein